MVALLSACLTSPPGSENGADAAGFEASYSWLLTDASHTTTIDTKVVSVAQSNAFQLLDAHGMPSQWQALTGKKSGDDNIVDFVAWDPEMPCSVAAGTEASIFAGGEIRSRYTYYLAEATGQLGALLSRLKSAEHVPLALFLGSILRHPAVEPLLDEWAGTGSWSVRDDGRVRALEISWMATAPRSGGTSQASMTLEFSFATPDSTDASAIAWTVKLGTHESIGRITRNGGDQGLGSILPLCESEADFQPAAATPTRMLSQDDIVNDLNPPQGPSIRETDDRIRALPDSQEFFANNPDARIVLHVGYNIGTGKPLGVSGLESVYDPETRWTVDYYGPTRMELMNANVRWVQGPVAEVAVFPTVPFVDYLAFEPPWKQRPMLAFDEALALYPALPEGAPNRGGWEERGYAPGPAWHIAYYDPVHGNDAEHPRTGIWVDARTGNIVYATTSVPTVGLA